MIGLIFQNKLILIKQMHQKNVIFVAIFIFFKKSFKYEPYLCNVCHDLMQKALNFSDAAIVSMKESDYKTHFWYMGKDSAIKIIKKYDFLKKFTVINFF